jgi:hypothetical protein
MEVWMDRGKPDIPWMTEIKVEDNQRSSSEDPEWMENLDVKGADLSEGFVFEEKALAIGNVGKIGGLALGTSFGGSLAANATYDAMRVRATQEANQPKSINRNLDKPKIMDSPSNPLPRKSERPKLTPDKE